LYLPDKCNRYKAEYSSSFEQSWKAIDPDRDINGPSIWMYKKNYYGYENVIL